MSHVRKGTKLLCVYTEKDPTVLLTENKIYITIMGTLPNSSGVYIKDNRGTLQWVFKSVFELAPLNEDDYAKMFKI